MDVHSRKLNHRINRLNERALRIVYDDYESSFQKLLEISNSFTIHERNIQSLAIEIYKVVNNLAPEIMNLVFQKNLNAYYPRQSTLKTVNVKTTSWGINSLAHLGPKIWDLVPKEFKSFPLSIFKQRIRSWKPPCPCRICAFYQPSVGFLSVL